MNKYLAVLGLFLAVLATNCTNREKEPKITEYVNPFMGMDGYAHCSPGPTIPFEGIQLNPDYLRSDSVCSAGYQDGDSVIASFSLTHLSDSGIHDLQKIRLLPVITKPDSDIPVTTYSTSNYGHFSHTSEQAEAGYYSVTFDNGIKTELSTTERCGFQYYQYPAGGVNALLIDLTTTQQRDLKSSTYIKKINNRTLEGYRIAQGAGQDQRVYFVIEFSQDCNVLAGSDQFMPLENGQKITPASCYLWIDFGQATNKILAKVSTSPVSCEDAMAHLQKELPHWSFDKVRRDAKHLWRKELAKTRAEGKNEKQLELFYTALYHAYTAPYIYATHPLYAITQKKRGNNQTRNDVEKPDKIETSPNTTLHTLCNSTDCRLSSAQFALSSMGFHPVQPVAGRYQLGTPLFDKVTIKVGPEKKFIISANKESDAHLYLEAVFLNGKKLNRTWITLDEIMQGGELRFLLTTEPV